MVTMAVGVSITADNVIVRTVAAILRVSDEIAACKGVDNHVNHARAGHHGAGHTKVGHAGLFTTSGSHAASSKGQGENNVGDWVDNHVSDHAPQAFQTLYLCASAGAEDGRCGDLTTKLKVHD